MIGHISYINHSGDLITVKCGTKLYFAYFDIDKDSHLDVGMKVEIIVTGEAISEGEETGTCIIHKVLNGGLRSV